MKTLTNHTKRPVSVPYRFEKIEVNIQVARGRQRVAREVVKYKDLRAGESILVEDRLAEHPDTVRLKNSGKILIKG